MNNFENRIKRNYNFRGETQGNFPFEEYLTPVSYSVAYPLDKIDVIFCNILHIKGGKILKHTFAGLLGFSIIDIPEQKKYKDLGEESIFNALLKNLQAYNLLIETKEKVLNVEEEKNSEEKLSKEKVELKYEIFIELTKDGENAIINNQKFKYYQADFQSYQGTKNLILPAQFPFLDVFNLQNLLQNKREILSAELPIYCNNSENLNKIKLFCQRENKLLYSIQEENKFSACNRIVDYHYYSNSNNVGAILVYQDKEYSDILTQIINKYENLEFKNNLIFNIRFKTLWEDNNYLIDSLVITEFFNFLNWNELANRNLDWEDEQVLLLFNENASVNAWHMLTQNLPENYLLFYFEKYIEKWDWIALSGRLPDSFVYENITKQDYKWNFEILSHRSIEFVKSLIKKVKEYNQNTLNPILAEWDFFALTESLDNDFIFNTITENIGLDFNFISKKDPDFVLSLLKEIKKYNENIVIDFQKIQIIWDWKYISKNWQIETIWENIDLFSQNIDWYILLNRIFSDTQNKDKYINDESFSYKVKDIKDKTGPIRPAFTTENILWDKKIVDFLEDLDLLLWYSTESKEGFECNNFITADLENFEIFKDKLQTQQGFDAVSRSINTVQFISEFPDFQWNWNVIFENKKLEITYQFILDFQKKWNWENLSKNLDVNFIEQNISNFELFWNYDILSQRLSDNFLVQNLNCFSWSFDILSKRSNGFIQNAIQENKNFTLLWNWQLLAKLLDIDFIKAILPQLNNQYAQILPNSISNFWKIITQRIEFDFIENNLNSFEFAWDWEYLTQTLGKDYILKNLSKFTKYWDWSYITKDILDKEEVKLLLSAIDVNYLFGIENWDWQYLVNQLFTVEEFTNDTFFEIFASSLNICTKEKQDAIWALLTKKLALQPAFLKKYMEIGLNNESIKLDYDFLSNYRRFKDSLTLNFVQKYQDKWNWNILSKNTDINADWNYLNKFLDKWDWSYISLHSCFLKSTNLNYFQGEKLVEAKKNNLKTLNKFKTKIDWQALSKRQDIIFDNEILENFSSQNWDFFALSNAKGLQINNEILLTYPDKEWDYQALSRSLDFRFYKVLTDAENQEEETNILLELKDKNWDWQFLSIHRSIELRYILLKETLNKDWNWKAITPKLDFNVNVIEIFLDLLQDKDIDWIFIQKESKFKPTFQIIEKYANKWDWELFSQNPNIEVNLNFVKKYIDKWNFIALTKNKFLLENVSNFTEFPNSNWDFSYLITKKEFLNNLSFLEIFANKLDWNAISRSQNFGNIDIEFLYTILDKFKWNWNFNILSNNPVVEQNGLLKNIISEILRANPAIQFISELEKQSSQWESSIYHFSR